MRLDELVELMLDVVCSKRTAIRISGEEMPAEVVKSRFLKLGAEHIQYVLDCLKDNPPRIRNIKQYLRTLIAGKAIHPRPCTHHADLLRKVAGLCNNANQLAHRANSTGTAGQGSVDEMTRLTQEVWREVKENW